jgi:YHS domain-containing protein
LRLEHLVCSGSHWRLQRVYNELLLGRNKNPITEEREVSQMNLRQFVLLGVFFLGSPAVFAQSGASALPVALKGYDPVTYFNPGKPARGASASYVDFDDSRFLFSSQRNRDLFASNPDKYSPQFSGLCATGLSMGLKTESDPKVFKVIAGKLYVFSSTEALQMALKDPTLLKKSHEAWAKEHKK